MTEKPKLKYCAIRKINNKWVAYWTKADDTGKRRQINLGEYGTPDMLDKYQDLFRMVEDPSGVQFRSIAYEYLDTLLRATGADRLASETLRGYKKILRDNGPLIQAIGGRPMDEITKRELVVYRKAQEGRKYMCNREIEVISNVFNFASEEGYYDGGNPAHGIKKYKEQPRERKLTDDEFVAIWEAMPKPCQVAMGLSYLTGLRLGDVLRLKHQDVRDGLLISAEVKTGNVARFVLYDDLQWVIDQSGNDLGPIVHREDGKAYTQSGFQAIWHRYKGRSGVADFRFHDMRAKCATDLIETELQAYLAEVKGEAQAVGASAPVVDLEAARNQLGHENAKMTRHYVRHGLGRIVPPGNKLPDGIRGMST